jgi:hypothetical protein
MDTATDTNNSTKRVRFNQASTSKKSMPSTAISCAKFSASVTIASLPDAITPLAEHYFTKFLALKVELQQLASTKARLANADFVPTSARFKLKLEASARVKEQATAELRTLTDDSEYILAIFKADIKKRINRLVDLEIKVATDELQQTFCFAAGAIGIAMALHHFGVDEARTKPLVITTFETNEELLKHSGLPKQTPQERTSKHSSLPSRQSPTTLKKYTLSAHLAKNPKMLLPLQSKATRAYLKHFSSGAGTPT